MDPIARRFMWDVINKISIKDQSCSVILTTHAMEEAEALCSRIGVMVNGRLTCLGSSQHLKQRFGNGFEINIKTQFIQDSLLNDFISTNIEVFRPYFESMREDSRVDIPSILTLNITSGNLKSFCAALNKESRYNLISSTGDGRQLYDVLQSEGTLPMRLFTQWWLAEDQADVLSTFFMDLAKELLVDCQLLERSSLYSFRYRISRLSGENDSQNEISLSYLFNKFETNKEMLQINEYSIGQTTLEQIFNQFASIQDNPEVAAKSIAIKALP